MKHTALILLFCIFGMVFQPVFGSMHHGCGMEKTKSCCAAKHQSHDQTRKSKSDDCCSNGTCNTCGICGCCFGYYAPVQSLEVITILPVAKTLNATVPQFLPSDIIKDNFHPPQLV